VSVPKSQAAKRNAETAYRLETRNGKRGARNRSVGTDVGIIRSYRRNTEDKPRLSTTGLGSSSVSLL
jgi:hypothetical protein